MSWGGTQYPKLKTNLRLAINRMKMMGKKKTELAMKARTEIAEYISTHRADRARIRVEHIIREDYLVEAYELLEMYCDLLLARFGLIEQMKSLDDGIAEAVISILWAAPRVTTDIPEFKVISDQLTHKYGKPFAEAARSNQLEAPAKVSPKLIAKLDISAPPKPLVERYMIEIASAAGVPFTPDPNVMREDEVRQAEQMLIKFHEQGGGSGGSGPGYGGSGSGSGGGGGGFAQPVPNAQPSVDGYYGWNSQHGASGLPPPGGAPPPPPGAFNPNGGNNIYEVPSHKYDVPPGNDIAWPPASQPAPSGPGVVQLPQIGPNGLPINPPSGPPHAPPTAAYPFLSQRKMLLMSRRKTTSFTTSCKGSRKTRNNSRPCQRSNSARPAKERAPPPTTVVCTHAQQQQQQQTNGHHASHHHHHHHSQHHHSHHTHAENSLMQPGAGTPPSAPPQTLRKEDAASPADLGNASSADVKWRAGDALSLSGSIPKPPSFHPPAPPAEHIYASTPDDAHYERLQDVVRRPADFAGQPPPPGYKYVLDEKGVPRLVRQDAFDASHDLTNWEPAATPLAPAPPFIDAGARTLETFRSSEVLELDASDIVFPAVPSDALGRGNNNNSGNAGGRPGGGDDLDFDALAKRFEELKKR